MRLMGSPETATTRPPREGPMQRHFSASKPDEAGCRVLRAIMSSAGPLADLVLGSTLGQVRGMMQLPAQHLAGLGVGELALFPGDRAVHHGVLDAFGRHDDALGAAWQV